MSKHKAEFIALMTKVMAGYGKSMPEAQVMQAWQDMLAPFSWPVIRQAFSDYALERPDFAPAPNGIAARCKLLDGRPDENEAWATALRSRHEDDTIVWTAEIAVAYGICAVILAGGDEIGARMAFKDAYSRLVAESRALSTPIEWKVSAGWNERHRRRAVADAVAQGLLEAPERLRLGFDGESDQPARPEGLTRLKELLATLEDPRAKAEKLRIERLKAAQQAEEQKKQEIAEQVRQYQQQHPGTPGQ